jgi:3'-5' exoribonuclease
METLSITDLKAHAPANPGEYAVHAQVAAVHRKETKGGKPYYEVELADAGGAIKLKAWQDSAAFPQAEASDTSGGKGFVCASGQWYQNGTYGLDAKDWSMRSLDDDEAAAVLAGPDELRAKQAEDYALLEAVCSGLSDPRLRALCASFFAKFGERLKRTAAARSNHHARRGGLVEHTAQMMRSADAICSVYDHLNRDLVLAGVLFHDCGKLWENNFPEKGFTMPFDFRAELMGHIPIGVEIVNVLWREVMKGGGSAGWQTLEPPSDHVRLHLIHLILSHHGQLEFGSPVLPKTPEAMALHFVDNIDAKLEMFTEGYQTSKPLSGEVFDRVWTIGANLVRPLAHFDATENPPSGSNSAAGERLPD